MRAVLLLMVLALLILTVSCGENEPPDTNAGTT
jgi:hypothetical protein